MWPVLYSRCKVFTLLRWRTKQHLEQRIHHTNLRLLTFYTPHKSFDNDPLRLRVFVCLVSTRPFLLGLFPVTFFGRTLRRFLPSLCCSCNIEDAGLSDRTWDTLHTRPLVSCARYASWMRSDFLPRTYNTYSHIFSLLFLCIVAICYVVILLLMFYFSFVEVFFSYAYVYSINLVEGYYKWGVCITI